MTLQLAKPAASSVLATIQEHHAQVHGGRGENARRPKPTADKPPPQERNGGAMATGRPPQPGFSGPARKPRFTNSIVNAGAFYRRCVL